MTLYLTGEPASFDQQGSSPGRAMVTPMAALTDAGGERAKLPALAPRLHHGTTARRATR